MSVAKRSLKALKEALGEQAFLLDYAPLNKTRAIPQDDDPDAVSIKILFGDTASDRTHSARTIWIYMYPASKPDRFPEIQFHSFDGDGNHQAHYDAKDVAQVVEKRSAAFTLTSAKAKIIALAKYYFLENLDYMNSDHSKMEFVIPLSITFMNDLKAACREYEEEKNGNGHKRVHITYTKETSVSPITVVQRVTEKQEVMAPFDDKTRASEAQVLKASPSPLKKWREQPEESTNEMSDNQGSTLNESETRLLGDKDECMEHSSGAVRETPSSERTGISGIPTSVTSINTSSDITNPNLATKLSALDDSQDTLDRYIHFIDVKIAALQAERKTKGVERDNIQLERKRLLEPISKEDILNIGRELGESRAQKRVKE